MTTLSDFLRPLESESDIKNEMETLDTKLQKWNRINLKYFEKRKRKTKEMKQEVTISIPYEEESDMKTQETKKPEMKKIEMVRKRINLKYFEKRKRKTKLMKQEVTISIPYEEESDMKTQETKKPEMKKSEMVRAPKHNNMTTWNSSNAFNYLFNQADIYQKEKQESETTTLPNKKKYLKQKYLQPLESASKVPATEEEEEDKRLREEFLELFNPSMEGAVQVPPYADDEKAIKKKKDKRWSLQEEIAMLFNTSLEGAFCRWEEGVSCSISPYPKEDGDYLCTSVLHVWPEIRKTHMYRGPTDAGLGVRENIMDFDYSDMIERCVVCGPGFLKFKLSRKWIAKSIHTMLKNGIDTWAPKLSVKKAIIYFLSQNIAEEMHMGHLRSVVIGETLARILEYSEVEVIRRYHEEDDLDIKLKMMTEFLIERFPNGEVNDEAIGELEVLYKESKKRFDEDAEFRVRAQQLQGWDERHHNVWVKICKISQENYQKVHQRLGVHVKEEGKSLHDSYVSKTLDLLREKDFTIDSEGDDAIFIEGRKLPLADLATLWHALDMVKADGIVHVTDVGQRDHIEMCISAAKHAGWIVNDHCPCPLSHAGFGLVEGDDFERLVNLLDEAKSRCKAVLMGQDKAYEWTAEELEHTAEALGYAAVKYANLKNNRLTNSTIIFDQMLHEKGNTVLFLRYTHAQICSVINKYRSDIKKLKKLKAEKVEELALKNDEERLLGLHLLRFTEVLGEVCTALMPHILCEYLFDLCNKFNSFHSSVCEVVEYGDEKSKLLLCEATSVVMRKCFLLLGITPNYKYRKEKESETTMAAKVPDKEENKYMRLVESQTTSAAKVPAEEKMASFSKGPCFLLELCNGVLKHNIDARVENGSSYNKLRLFGTIQAETHISDPSHYGSSDIFSRSFDDPLVITKPGFLSPHDIQYCSLTASTFVKITAKLYGTTYKGDDEMESISDYTKYYLEAGIPPEKLYGGITRKIDADVVRKRFAEYYEKCLFPPVEKEKKVYIDDDVFEVCDDFAFINFSEYFANRPNGGSGSFKLKGKDGYLELYYVALKNAAEAVLEVDFGALSKETKVVGRVIAYYGNNFCYGCSADEKHLYKTMLFQTEQPAEVKHGKLNLMRSVLAVPSQFSLIIDAEFTDLTSGGRILSGACEFRVPAVDDSMISVDCIEGNACAIHLKVDWNLPLLRNNNNTQDSPMDSSNQDLVVLFEEKGADLFEPTAAHDIQTVVGQVGGSGLASEFVQEVKQLVSEMPLANSDRERIPAKHSTQETALNTSSFDEKQGEVVDESAAGASHNQGIARPRIKIFSPGDWPALSQEAWPALSRELLYRSKRKKKRLG